MQHGLQQPYGFLRKLGSLRLKLWLKLRLSLAYVVVSFMLASQAVANCKVSEDSLNNEILALSSIQEQFQRLATASIEPTFSLATLFTVDLRNDKDVASRIQELQGNKAPPLQECDAPQINTLIKKRQKLYLSTLQSRLSYLTLSSEERHYLVSLIAIHNKLLQELQLIENNQQQRLNDIQALEQQLQQLETAFKSQQQPEQRAALFEDISNTNEQLQQFTAHNEQQINRSAAISPLLELAKALISDYHLFYQLTDTTEHTPRSQSLFNQLTSPAKLKKLVQITGQNTEQFNEYQTALSALIIIHGRLSIEPRKQETTTDLLNHSYESLTQTLKHEIKTLVSLPIANLHLKLFNNDADHHYLSRPLAHSAANLGTQLIALLLFWYFLKRIPLAINRTQQHLVRNHLTKRFARQTIAFLRFLQPNAAWLSAILFYYYLDSRSDQTLRDWILLYDVTAIIAFYLLINTLATWAINNTNGQAHLFVLRSKQQNIRLLCHRFALYITLSSIFYIILNNVLNGGIICSIYQIAIFFIVWLFSYRLITQFQPEFVTHLSKRVSEQNLSLFNRLQRPLLKAITNPVIFIALQFYDISLALHHRLLRLESYQAITAKFLKIRLEQSQSNTESNDKETQDDLHYGSWFTNQELLEAKPNLLLPNPWLDELNTRVDEWINDKLDENDLALVGDNGIGKSTLLKQWLEQWDKSQTVYIKIPSKTTKEANIFNLICAELNMEDTADIAQFVVKQQQIEKTVVVIDEAHHLFLSDVGGFEAYKMLQSLISAKLDNIFWVIAINRQSWIYLNDVFSRTYQFSNTIMMQRWTQQDIRELILRRHRASRRNLTYDDLLLASTSHSETATRAAESRCFSLLWDQSAGMPSVALAIWLNASRNPRKGQIEMGIPERPSSQVMQNLSDDHLFVYAALVTHESLNTQQAQAVTHLSEAIVRRALKQGLDQGFLVRKSFGRYIINPLWQLQLGQLLRRKNFLHE